MQEASSENTQGSCDCPLQFVHRSKGLDANIAPRPGVHRKPARKTTMSNGRWLCPRGSTRNAASPVRGKKKAAVRAARVTGRRADEEELPPPECPFPLEQSVRFRTRNRAN